MGEFILPEDHKPFIKVPPTGSSCANCIFLSEDKKHCTNKYFVKWYGKSLLPQPVNEWCSDWYEPNPEYLAKGGVVTAKAPYYFRKEKKKQHTQTLANSIKALRSQITKDLNSEDEKIKLTALVIAVIDNTAERVGNEVSEEDGHFGVTGLRKKHVIIEGNKVTLRYTGKSGVEHEKSFSNITVAESLREAIKTTPKRSIFVTSDGFRIKGDKVNRYLNDFNITAKDLRGHHANKYIIDKLKLSEIPSTEKERKILFKKAVKHSALKVGHKPLTLQKHYLISEVETLYIEKGEIINLKDFYMTNDGKDGGLLNGKTHAEGGIKGIVTDINKPVELETNEAIINANSMQMANEFVVTGTPSEIASAINEIGGGVKFDDGAKIETMENKKIWQQTFSEYSDGLSEDRKKLAKHTHNEQVRAAIKKQKYANAIVRGQMTSNQAMQIVKSSDLPIPSEISNLAAVENHARAEDHAKELAELKSETVIRAKEVKRIVSKKDVVETIEGLKVLAETKTGKEKTNIENTIDGLEILLETMPEEMEKGGYTLYKDGNIIHEIYN